MIDAIVLSSLLAQSPSPTEPRASDVTAPSGPPAATPDVTTDAATDVAEDRRPTVEEMAAGIEIPDVDDPLPIGADPLWGTVTATTGGLVGALAGTVAMTSIAAITAPAPVPDGEPEPPPTPEQTARNQFVTIGTLAAPIGLGVIGAAVAGIVVNDPALALTGAFGATAGAALGATGGFVAASAATSGASAQDADWIRASTFGGIVTLGTAAGAAVGGAIGAWVRMPPTEDAFDDDDPREPTERGADSTADGAGGSADASGDASDATTPEAASSSDAATP